MIWSFANLNIGIASPPQNPRSHFVTRWVTYFLLQCLLLLTKLVTMLWKFISDWVNLINLALFSPSQFYSSLLQAYTVFDICDKRKTFNRYKSIETNMQYQNKNYLNWVFCGFLTWDTKSYLFSYILRYRRLIIYKRVSKRRKRTSALLFQVKQ